MSKETNSDRPDPVLLNSMTDAASLEQVSFGSPAFKEAQLQELLRCHPRLLPLQELDPGFSPAVCIGRETRVGANALDNLFISPNGYLTLVETKLWKNPEARRQVVAQIIEYAKEIAKWNYATLAENAAEYLKKYEKWEGSLYEWLKKQKQFKDIPTEAVFIDRTSENLRHGRILLLIVGDGIRRDVEEMVSFFQDTPQLQYRLALVEMGCYRLPGKQWPLVVVPHLAVKTAEIERAVVRIEMSTEAKGCVTVKTNVPPTKASFDPSEEGFFSELESTVDQASAEQVRQFAQKMKQLSGRLFLSIRKTGLAIGCKTDWEHPAWNPWLLSFHRNGEVSPGMLKQFKAKEPLRGKLRDSYWKDLGKIHPSLQPTKDEAGKLQPFPQLPEVVEKLDQIGEAIQKFIAEVEKHLVAK